MNKNPITLAIDRELHHQVKTAAVKRRMKVREFAEYVIRKGMNLTSRKP